MVGTVRVTGSANIILECVTKEYFARIFRKGANL